MNVPSRDRIAAVIAGLLGLVTLVAGGRVLLGGDPGYAVVRPVLLFNVAMGVLYLAAAVAMVRAPARGRTLAWLIAEANALVLVAVLVMRLLGIPVATQTVAAMAFRTFAWFGIVAALRFSPSSRARERSNRRGT